MWEHLSDHWSNQEANVLIKKLYKIISEAYFHYFRIRKNRLKIIRISSNNRSLSLFPTVSLLKITQQKLPIVQEFVEKCPDEVLLD
jgi:hypothetical protein